MKNFSKTITKTTSRPREIFFAVCLSTWPYVSKVQNNSFQSVQLRLFTKAQMRGHQSVIMVSIVLFAYVSLTQNARMCPLPLVVLRAEVTHHVNTAHISHARWLKEILKILSTCLWNFEIRMNMIYRKMLFRKTLE